MAPRPEIVDYVRNAAIKRGIDPNVALRVAASEALNVFDPDKPDRGGDDGSSFGLFQLHYANMSAKMPNAGLGDEFTAKTGLDARNPSTWRQQVDFSLDYARKNGWGSWMGAKRVGIKPYEGIGTTQPAATATTSPSGVTPSYETGTGGQQTPPIFDPNSQPVVDMNDAYNDLLATRPPGEREAPQSLLADTMADSVVRSARRPGGLVADMGDRDAPITLPEPARASAPEAAPVEQEPAVPTTTPLADLFKVKDIGLANSRDPLSGIPRLLRTRRAYG